MAPAGTMTVKMAATHMRMHMPRLATRMYTTSWGVCPLGVAWAAAAVAAAAVCGGWSVAGWMGTAVCEAAGVAAAVVEDAPLSQAGVGLLLRGGDGDLMRDAPGPGPPLGANGLSSLMAGCACGFRGFGGGRS